jgi:drug/metabolite transporter (DMT)-like permease
LNGAVVSALVASLSTAVAMLGLHRLRHIHPWAIVAHFSGVATVFCLASLFVPDPGLAPRPAPHAAALPLLFGVGVTATVGQLFLTKAFAAGPPAKVSVVGLTQVVFAVGLDVWLWGHTFTAPALVGIGLVLAPTAWLMAGRGESDAALAS